MATYAGAISLVLFDVDGVLTDGSLYFTAEGETLKSFNVRDGLGIALLRAHGIRSGVLSGRSSGPLDHRVEQLGFDIAVVGQLQKEEALRSICQSLAVDAGSVAYVGDDVIDLPLAGAVGHFFAPSDAHPLVLSRADTVLSSRGGRGAGRETAERVLAMGGIGLEQAYSTMMGSWEHFDAAQ